MAIVIKETKFTNEELEKYLSKGYRCAVSNGVDFPKVHKNEPVAFILSEYKLYSINMRQIEWLVKTNHRVTVKLNDKVWNRITSSEWHESYKDPKNPRKWITRKHEVLQLFEIKQQEYYDKIAKIKAEKEYDKVMQLYLNEDVPSDLELQTFIDTWSKAYDVQVNFEDRKDVLLKYKILKYYVDHNLDVSIPETEPDVVYVGDENLFEDLIYKGDIEGI